MERREFRSAPELFGERLDSVLARLMPDQTRSYWQKLCEERKVTVDGRPVSKSYRLSGNEQIVAELPDPVELEVQPEDIPLTVVYEDEALLVVNKPKGMVVHPAPGNPDKTLVNALLYHCRGQLSGINGVQRPGIVHRIDKDTSGLLIVAKTDAAHRVLAEQIAEHSFLREYHTIVYGKFRDWEGTVDAPIGRHPVDRKRMAVTERGGKRAVTHYTVLEELGDFCYLRCRLETGRTHQIRVHMAYLGHPVAGDPVYGPQKVISELHGQCLHAKVLGFTHPITGEHIVLDSPLPDYFEAFLKKLRRKAGVEGTDLGTGADI